MRLKEKFNQLKKQGRKAFIAYVPFGFPEPKLTKPICLALAKGGVDIIELGIPFSDPLADGPIIQQATAKALAAGANLDNFFGTLKELSSSLTIPIVIMTYYNPVFKYGLERFLKRLKSHRVCATLIVDLPIEEAGQYLKSARGLGVDTVFFVTPTTDQKRMRKIINRSRGFIYYISVTGITGPKNIAYRSVARQVEFLKKISPLPVCVGFGIHSAEQVRAVNEFSDGAIVGSALVEFIDKNYRKKGFLNTLAAYTSKLCMK
ncbi:MAG: tryptophan synthase subunit alpha [Candidatus Omnitrophica bacterium]|nr:tryptophan synthase subunit alpha [Candidatus Omnitrophota bacterium]MBU2251728.1 tryptophan synthase subunit alpha [Candidatus Omnitrophota bacterium]MBU2473773.1 tryptophan synthase subunit alpha [Candidatus Omnitrophota bacterium]